LQHLESAIEKGFENPPPPRSSRQQQQQHIDPVSSQGSGSVGGARAEDGTASNGSVQTSSTLRGGADEDSGKALEVAIRITELPMEVVRERSQSRSP